MSYTARQPSSESRFRSDNFRVVITAVRNPEHETAKALADLPNGVGSNLVVVKYDAMLEQDAFDLDKELQGKHGIKHVDIVIPNTVTGKLYPLVKDVRREDTQGNTELNAYSMVSLHQATRELLETSFDRPKFAPMGYGAGALGQFLS